MIFRLEYCNKFGDAVRVDITTPGLPTVVEVEGAGDPFRLKYTPDIPDKSFRFLTSSAEINIYETPLFNIDTLKTSSETDIKVDYYINGVREWVGFVLPDFFSKEIRGNAVVSMSASDRISTLKSVTLSDLPAKVSIRELAVKCLDKTGLSLPLKTMADFTESGGYNAYFRSEIPSQRLVDNKGRSISCYDILSSILVTSNSFLEQRKGEWYIINKLQHELGEGKLFSTETAATDYSEVTHNFSEITRGAMRTIIPVAASVGVFHEHGGGKLHPDNYDFSQDSPGSIITGWNKIGGFTGLIDNRKVSEYTTGGTGQAEYLPKYGEPTQTNYLVNNNQYVRNDNPIYLESNDIDIPYTGSGAINVEVDINATGPAVYPNFAGAYIRAAVVAVSGSEVLTLDHSGKFIKMPSINPPVFEKEIERGWPYGDSGNLYKALSPGMRISGTLEASDLSAYKLRLRIYGGGGGRAVLFNSASISMKSSSDVPKGNLYKREQGSNFTKTHEIETSIFGDYITGGLNGYFYDYPIDDTSSLYIPSSGLRSRWIDPTDPNSEELPLLQHVVRQKARMFSVAHDKISGEIEMVNFDPLAIFVDCSGKRYSLVSAEVDFLRSTVNFEIEEIAYQNLTVRDFIYSYFGEGESNIKSVGGIASGSGGGTGGGLTPEQLEILSFWKKDPDRENTIFTEMNAYSKLELSAYGAGDGGGGGGSDYERLDTWASYDSSKAGWVLSALLGNELNTRVGNLEGGSALTVNTTGTGNAITSISKAGTVVTATKDLTFSLDNHLHTGVYEPVFSKNTAFNKNFGTTAGTVAEGNDSRIINGQTAFGWGNHASAGYALSSSLSNYLPLTGGTLTGNLTAPTFIGALNGNASSATKLQTARTIAGVSFDGTANIAIPFANLSSKPTTLGGYGITDAVTLNTAQTISGEKTFSGTVTAPTFIGALNGNATSATALQTARTLTIGNTGKTFNGTENVSWSLADIGAASISGGMPSSIAAYNPYWVGRDGRTNDMRRTNAPYVINHHTGISLSAHSAYSGIRLWLQGSGSPYDHDGTLVAQFSTAINHYVHTAATTITATGNITAPTFIGALTGNASTATNADMLDGYHLVSLTGRSVYNATNGVLVATTIPATTNAMIYGRITGNSYSGAGAPIDTAFQFYNDSIGDAIIRYSALNNGYSIAEIKAFNYNDLVYIYIPYLGVYQSINVELWQGQGKLKTDVTAGANNAAMPETGVTRLVTIIPLQSALTTSNVASATKLQTARTIAGVSFDGTANIAIPFANLSSKPTTLGGYEITDAVTLNTAQTISGAKTFTDSVTAPTFVGSLNGNATSATALQTARTIWGQSFSGESNVSGAMTGVTSLSMTGALSGATTIEASISVTSPKVIFSAAGWSMEQVGSELQMKHNNVLKMRFTSTGSIVATEEITAFG